MKRLPMRELLSEVIKFLILKKMLMMTKHRQSSPFDRWWHKGSLLQMAQAITTQAQDSTTQAQAMITQSNPEVVTWANQHVGTMATHLRDFTRMNPPNFYRSKIKEDLPEFIDEIYNIIYAMGLTTSEKDELTTYQLKDVHQAWHVE